MPESKKQAEEAPDETPGVEPPPEKPSLNDDIRARLDRPHKGDVGRPETNEEIYQGSKTREIE